MNTNLIYSLLAAFFVLCACSAPTKNETTDQPMVYGEWEAPDVDINTVNFDQMPFSKLSDYGFFKGKIREFNPGKGVVLYEPASSLFTDYAFKTRYIWMPDGASATIQDDSEGTIDFPENTVLIKNFYYPADFRNPLEKIRVIETRIMVKKNGAWEAFPYLWNEEQTDAIYKAVGAEVSVDWVDQQGQAQFVKYIVPNQAQCKSCHNSNEVMVPLGVKAKQLNHALPGKGNQLIAWEEAGYLEELKPLQAYPAMVDYSDISSDLNLRAKAYLDSNCAHCHRAEGPASTSGLFLNYEETDPAKLGVFKTPVAAGFGAGSFTYAIWPGKSNESILTYRMGTNQVGAAMPEIGRGLVHREGLELIKAWIDAMPEESFHHLSAGKR